MKVSYLYFFLSASWLSSVLAGGAKGKTMTDIRNLEVDTFLEKKVDTDVTEVASTETRTQNYSYESSDFEYISSLPSKKSKKGSKKGKGGSKSSKKSSGSSGSSGRSSGTAGSADGSDGARSPTVSPTFRPTAVDEINFGLDEFSLFYIPTGQDVRLPTTLENSELLEVTNFYIDWFFKMEYPSSVRTDLREVVTKFEGDNEFTPNQPIKKTFQSEVIFAVSTDIPSTTELEATLASAFDDQNIDFYMEFLNGPYPPPPEDSVGELSGQNIFKGSTASVEEPILSTADATGTSVTGASVTGIMIAAAAVGFTLLVAGIAICNKESHEHQQPQTRDLDKRPEEATVADESLTLAADTLHSGQDHISPLSFHDGERDGERGPTQQDQHNSLLMLPVWDEETVHEEQMEDVSLSTNSFANGDVVHGDRKAVSDWRRQRGAENDPIRVDSFDSFDEQTLSDSSTSSDPSQPPKSVAELTSLLSSRLPSYNPTEEIEYEEEVIEDEYEEEIVEDDEEDEIQSSEDVDESERPKTVKELQEMLFAGGTVVKRGVDSIS